MEFARYKFNFLENKAEMGNMCSGDSDAGTDMSLHRRKRKGAGVGHHYDDDIDRIEEDRHYINPFQSNENRNGHKTFTWPDGSVYTGNWEDNLFHGHGEFKHANGDRFEGNFVYGKAEGKGTYTHQDGNVYEGDWRNDLQHGRGRETKPDGSVYNGEFYMGKKHGQGVYEWADGSKYDGSWRDNMKDGYGIYTWPDGSYYKGSFSENKMHGKGFFDWCNGKTYEGDFYNDKKQGIGIFRWPKGVRYVGGWFENEKHGIGSIYLNDKERRGEWQNGKRVRWLDDDEDMDDYQID